MVMKLEHEECNVLLTIIENHQFRGGDIPVLAKIIGKLQKESEKTAPDVVIKG
jgi:hypothetical protein|tara:strand:- start:496 stop:654 length:159 start_codon:yes stop_codon:yes gene_type:complete